jgi:hypothetical protein
VAVQKASKRGITIRVPSKVKAEIGFEAFFTV